VSSEVQRGFLREVYSVVSREPVALDISVLALCSILQSILLLWHGQWRPKAWPNSAELFNGTTVLGMQKVRGGSANPAASRLHGPLRRSLGWLVSGMCVCTVIRRKKTYEISESIVFVAKSITGPGRTAYTERI
jgi:hypothetical protein